MLDLLFISLLLVFIVDLSGFVEVISERIGKIIYPKVKYNGGLIPKPFSCSLCCTWGAGIIYLLVTGTFSGGLLAYVAGLAFFTTIAAKILLLIRDLLDGLLSTIWKLLD